MHNRPTLAATSAVLSAHRQSSPSNILVLGRLNSRSTKPLVAPVWPFTLQDRAISKAGTSICAPHTQGTAKYLAVRGIR